MLVLTPFQFTNSTDYDDYILYPSIKLTPTIDGTISIFNSTTNETVTINNCVTTETITLDGWSDIIQSSSGRVLIDSWNKKFFSLANGDNNITLTVNFTMIMEYRLPVRVGG